LRRLRLVVNRPQTDLRSVRLREVNEPRSSGICARTSICSGHSAAEFCSLRYAGNGGCCNARAGNGASDGKRRLTAVPSTIGRLYFHTVQRSRSQGRGCSYPESPGGWRRAIGAHCKFWPTPNRDSEISPPPVVRADPAQRAPPCVSRDPTSMAAPCTSAPPAASAVSKQCSERKGCKCNAYSSREGPYRPVVRSWPHYKCRIA
jgi:hypothetical protein